MSSPNRKEPLDTVEPQPESTSPLERLSRFWSRLTARRDAEHGGDGPHMAFLQRLKKIASPTVSPTEAGKDSSDHAESVASPPVQNTPCQEETSATMAEAGVAMKRAFSELARALSITARVTSRTVTQSEGIAKLGGAMKKGMNSLTGTAKSEARRFSRPAEQTKTGEETPPQKMSENIETPETLDLKAKAEALKQADRQAQVKAEEALKEVKPKKRGRPPKVKTSDHDEPAQAAPRKTATKKTTKSTTNTPARTAKTTQPKTTRKKRETTDS